MTNIKKRKIYKNIYELLIKYTNKLDFKEIRENYIYNGNSVSAICFNKQDQVFYFIRQMRPNYFFNKFSPYPLEIVAGGIKNRLGVKPISVKKLESLIIAPDILEEITDIYLAYVPRITNFKIINPNEGEYIKIIPMKKKQILEILKTNRTQNIVTKYSFLKIKELKI